MESGTIFEIAGSGAMLGWLALAAAPLAPRVLLPAGGIAMPLALSALYAIAAAIALPGAPGGFGSLPEVMALFADPGAATVGWVHFLAFDLLVGGWQARDARARGVPHLAVLPCLFLTLMLGPVGLLAYLGLRAIASRRAVPA